MGSVQETQLELVRRGLEASRNKQWAVVINCFQQFLGYSAVATAVDPAEDDLLDAARAHSSLATAYIHVDELDRALEHAHHAIRLAETAVSITPASEVAWRALSFHLAYLGTLCMGEQRWEEAAVALQDSLTCQAVILHRNPDTGDSTADVARTALAKVIRHL